MSVTISGIVKNGVVVPSTPLPEGAHVEINVKMGAPDVPVELQEEFDGWNRASAQALELVERLAQEMDTNDKR